MTTKKTKYNIYITDFKQESEDQMLADANKIRGELFELSSSNIDMLHYLSQSPDVKVHVVDVDSKDEDSIDRIIDVCSLTGIVELKTYATD